MYVFTVGAIYVKKKIEKRLVKPVMSPEKGCFCSFTNK